MCLEYSRVSSEREYSNAKIERSAGLTGERYDKEKTDHLVILAHWIICRNLCLESISEKTIWFFVQDAGTQAMDIGSRMVPPKFTYMDKLWGPVWDTINIATLGTVIALIIAVPVAFSAAKNTTLIPHTYHCLFIIVSSRSVNSLIWALILFLSVDLESLQVPSLSG
ncbi:MAG: hypothetical protein Ct9H300mP28_34130 [Pseudomonadota bacterium]|nr:MAG: hypothetical protein Ct9H300mP28_34130 [Pseudomonadota bacterium]